jgi:hypothetical protein
MIKNWSDASVQRTAKQRNDAERAFFDQGRFQELPRNMVGIQTLCHRLSNLLLRHLTQELPSLQKEMRTKLEDTNMALMKLGDKRETPAEQRMVLMKISMKINHIISSAVNGHYLHDFFGSVDLDSSIESENNIRRFRAVIQNLNHEFAENMRLRGHTFNFEFEEEKDQNQDSTSNPQSNDINGMSGEQYDGKPASKVEQKANGKNEKEPSKKKRKTKSTSTDSKDSETDGLPSPRNISYNDALDWVKDTIIRCRGHELPGSVNPEVTSHLFWEQAAPWKEIAQDHIEKVRVVCKEFVRQILDHAAPTEFKKPLEDLLVTSALEETVEDAQIEFGKLLDDNARHPRYVERPSRGFLLTRYSTYDHCYSDSLQKKRNKKYAALTASARKAATTTLTTAEGGLPAATQFDADVFQQIMTKAVERNMMTFAAEEALESQNAYYQDKLKYFIHAITCQVIERCMVDPLPTKLLSPMVVTAMSDEQVGFIAGEPPETIAQRAFLEDKKKMLENGFDIFRDAMGGVKRIRTSA